MSVYISEYNVWSAAGGDFVEVAAPTGTSLAGYDIYIYAQNGTIANGPHTLGTSVANENGHDIYVVDTSSPGFHMSDDSSVALVDDNGDVVQFLRYANYSGNAATEGPALGLTPDPTTNFAVNHSVQSDDGGATYYNQPAQNKGSIPCFAAGTCIRTPQGFCRVEEIEVGQHIVVPGSAPKQVIWTSQQQADMAMFETSGFPILIKAHALGLGRPERDLVVSPQHRILLGVHGQMPVRFLTPCLVPAKALLSLKGVRSMLGKQTISWHHFAFATHGLTQANGCITETLLIGPMFLNGLPRRERRRIFAVFNRTSHQAAFLNGPPAAALISVSEARDRIEQIAA